MDKIVLNHVTYTYPLASSPALDDVTFTFEKGKFYGVIGENGSGKTTLCNLLRGLIPNFYKGTLEGTITYDGVNSTDIDEDCLSISIGYVFQNPFTQISGVRKTVFEEVALGLENLGVPPEEIIERVIRVLERMGISELALKNPTELSGGQRQRVAFASIVVMDADVMVIDEPTSQLDPAGSQMIFAIIDELKKQNKTIILVEHKIKMIADYCDEVLVMKEGKLICSGDTHTVLSDLRLSDYGIDLPEVAMVAYALKDKGMSLASIPITEDECCWLIKQRWRENGRN